MTAPLSKERCYCGSLDWTVERYGRVTHKEGCPRRTDPWHQGDPQTGELVAGLRGEVDRLRGVVAARDETIARLQIERDEARMEALNRDADAKAFQAQRDRAEQRVTRRDETIARLEAAGDKLADAAQKRMDDLHRYDEWDWQTRCQNPICLSLRDWLEVRGLVYPDEATTAGEEAECPPEGAA